MSSSKERAARTVPGIPMLLLLLAALGLAGWGFVQAIQAHMPDRLVMSTTGSLLTFGA